MSVLYVTQACSERELISTFRSTNESIAYTEKRSKTIVLTLICTNAKSNWSLLRAYEGENTNPYLALWLLTATNSALRAKHMQYPGRSW